MSEIKKAVVFIGAVLFLGACILMAGEVYECGLVAGIAGIILMIVPPIHTAWKNQQNSDKKDIDEK